MKRGLSLVELAKKIEAQKELKADYVAPSRGLRLTIQDDNKPALEVPDTGSFPILRTAHDQIGAKLNIPAKYYNRMLDAAPRLLADNVNHWLDRDPSRRMLRTLGGDLRAYLSDRYNRVENEEIAEVVLPVLLETPGLSVNAAEITDHRMYILATTDRVKGELKRGDVVQAGVLISNSEIGHGAVSIRPMVYRLVCLNGMVLPDAKLTANHVGRRISEGEDLNAIFSDEARRADDRALLLKVRDVVRHALDAATFENAVGRMRDLGEQKIEGDPSNTVQLLAKKIGATDDERGGILRALIDGGDTSALGLIHAVTFQAHAAKSFDRAVEFETTAGQLLNLPRREWRELLAA